MGSVKKFWRDQQGVVESSLVMIPLVILFLLTTELIVAVNFRNVDQNLALGAASAEAISGIVPPSDEVISLSSTGSFEKLRLVVSHRNRPLPWLLTGIPFLNTSKSAATEVTGVAVMEDRP